MKDIEMPDTDLTALVSAEWLKENIGRDDVAVLDASWYLPAQNRDPIAEFAEGHIPGAQFFHIDQIADKNTELPHMIPSTEDFAEAVGGLGIGNDHQVIVYDGMGLQSAARAWWMFKVFGHQRVAVLDGGLPAWKESGGKTEAAAAPPTPAAFEATLRPEIVHSLDQINGALGQNTMQVLDARGARRFDGSEPEPRAGTRSGHIPGSLSLPFTTLLEPGTMKMKPLAELKSAIDAAGIKKGTPIVTTCGSGITACILSLSLQLVGRTDVAVYDGSWTEWGRREDVPIEV